MAKKIILKRYNIMMIFILTDHSVSPILIHTVTLITLKSYSVPVMSFPTDILFVESFQVVVAVEGLSCS
jgi:hypothetical protein